MVGVIIFQAFPSISPFPLLDSYITSWVKSCSKSPLLSVKSIFHQREFPDSKVEVPYIMPKWPKALISGNLPTKTWLEIWYLHVLTIVGSSNSRYFPVIVGIYIP